MIIDTLKIEINGLQILKDKHLNNFHSKTNTKNRPTTWFFNPDKTEERYLPVVELKEFTEYDRFLIRKISAQFSAPKIINKNNYFGIDENDYHSLIEKLEKDFDYIFNDNVVTKNHIINADIQSVAFAFNFVLPNSFPNTIELLKIIPFLSLGKRYKKIKPRFYPHEEEFGFNVGIYNKQVGARFYDKGAQTINCSKTPEEKEISKKIKIDLLPRNVARFEITFQNRTPVKKHLTTKLGGNSLQERKLHEIFNNNLCQSILLEAFNTLANDLDVQSVDFPLIPVERAFRIAKRAGLNDYDVYAFIGRARAVQQLGSLQLSLISDNYYDRRERFRTNKKMEKIMKLNPLPTFTYKEIFDKCRDQLERFKIMKPEDFMDYGLDKQFE